MRRGEQQKQTIKAKRIRECECTCHVYGQTHKHQTRLVLFTRGSETPMHLPRLWTDALVDLKTQVNKTREGLTGQEEPILGPDRSKKGPTERTRGAKAGTEIKPKDNEVKREVRPRRVGEGKERGLCLTPLSVFKMVAFVCSESVIPAIPDGKGDRFLCFTYCCQATYVVACSLERSDVKIRCSFA